MDDDGYPTDEELKAIEEWDFFDGPSPSSYQSFLEFMDYIKDRWWMASWGWDEKLSPEDGSRTGLFLISTGGWSGNESIIAAMQKNWMFWAVCWEQSRKGGHYIFQLPQHESFKEVKYARKVGEARPEEEATPEGARTEPE